MTTVKSMASVNDADTYGWDTAFVTNFTNANIAITTGWPNVPDKAKNLAQTAFSQRFADLEAAGSRIP